MEAIVRGYLERYIDDELNEERLFNRITLMTSLIPVVSSIEDAVLGFILGDAFGRLVHHYRYVKNINIVSDEIVEDYVNIVTRRAQEIKSRINEIANL